MDEERGVVVSLGAPFSGFVFGWDEDFMCSFFLFYFIFNFYNLGDLG